MYTFSVSLRAGTRLAVLTLAAAALLQVPTPVHAAPLAPTLDDTTAVDTPTSSGDDFWIAFPGAQDRQLRNSVLADFGELYISADAAGTVTVEVPRIGLTQSITVEPDSPAHVELDKVGSSPTDTYGVKTTDGVEDLGVHISATTDVSVFAYQAGSYSNNDSYDATILALPTEGLGQRYRVLSYSSASATWPSQLTVVATADDTDVTITPEGAAGVRVAGEPFDVSLDQGEVYQLASDSDITGTLVESNLPVAVYGVTGCAQVPTGSTRCNQLVQQLPPTTAWGSDFVSTRYLNRNEGDTYRVLADEDDTVITVNGDEVATIDAGEFWEAVLPADSSSDPTSTSINTSQASLVAQYANSFTYDRRGGATMLLVPPTQQYLSTYTFPVIPAEALTTALANIVVPTDDVGALTLDGVIIPAADFEQVADTIYSTAQLTLDDPIPFTNPGGATGVVTGTGHTLAGPSPFGANFYANPQASLGYGYPAGMGLATINVWELAPEAPTVEPPAVDPPVVPTLVPDMGLVVARNVRAVDGTVPVSCVVTDALATSCQVTLSATVKGERTVLGRSTTTVSASQDTIGVDIPLNKAGLRLAARWNGVNVLARASAAIDSDDRPLTAHRATTVTTPAMRLSMPLVTRPVGGVVWASCIVNHAKADVCKVRLVALVHGERLIIGRGSKTWATGKHVTRVRIPLTLAGQRLADRLHGVQATAHGVADVASTDRRISATHPSCIMARHLS
jgi:hypothetical protein